MLITYISTTLKKQLPGLATLILGFFFFGHLVFSGAYVWRSDYNLQLVGFIFILFMVIVWLAWRGLMRHDRFPATGMEWAFGLCLLVMGISWGLSSDPRQGLERCLMLLGYVLLFYLLANLLRCGLNGQAWLAALLTVSGLVLAEAVLETYLWYLDWWNTSGFFNLPPSQYRFHGFLLANPTMAMGILLVGPAVMVFLKGKRRVYRLSGGIWLVFFVLALPFSSARSAWLGLAVMGGLFALAWAWNTKAWLAVKYWSMLKKTGLMLALVAGFSFAAWLGVKFLNIFASQASHGFNPFGDSGRFTFWQTFFLVWQRYPWFGTGPGRLTIEFLRMDPSVPFSYWPLHAHNIFLQAVGEFGLAGLAALLFLLASAGICLWRAWSQADSGHKLWIMAITLSFAGFLVPAQFEEFSSFTLIPVTAVSLLCWAICCSPSEAKTYPRIPAAWLGLPAMALLCGFGFWLWAYQPMAALPTLDSAAHLHQAAEMVSASAERDPAFHYYHTEAGLLWAWTWKNEHDPAALARARTELQAALALESSPSWTWANLAVLDEAAGDGAAALGHMQKAIVLSNSVGVYYLDLGRIEEEAGNYEQARAAFQQALILDPGLTRSVFWKTTPLRSLALAAWEIDHPFTTPVDGVSGAVAQALDAGQLEEAARLARQADLAGESSPALMQVELRLAEAQKDGLTAARLRLELAKSIYTLDAQDDYTYAMFVSNRAPTGIGAAPGLIPETVDPMQK